MIEDSHRRFYHNRRRKSARSVLKCQESREQVGAGFWRLEREVDEVKIFLAQLLDLHFQRASGVVHGTNEH